MVDEGGKTYFLIGGWISKARYNLFGHETFETFVFEIPEDAQISFLHFGPLPPIDIQRRVIVDISQQVYQNGERQKASEWMKANILSNGLVVTFSKQLDEAIAKRAWRKWHIGWSITNSKKPYIIHWADGSFQFEELTIEEAKKKKFKASSIELFARPDEVWMCY